MKAASLVLFSSVLLVLVPAASAQTRFFLGGGPTGTSAFGFNGGWGGTVGFEHRIAKPAGFLVRFEGAAVPSGLPFVTSSPAISEAQSLGEFSPFTKNATLLSVMAGLRLGGIARFAPYLDALVGVGYMNDPANTAEDSPYIRSDQSSATNVAFSFGPGVAVRAASLPTL